MSYLALITLLNVQVNLEFMILRLDKLRLATRLSFFSRYRPNAIESDIRKNRVLSLCLEELQGFSIHFQIRYQERRFTRFVCKHLIVLCVKDLMKFNLIITKLLKVRYSVSIQLNILSYH